ncbi:nuclear distribution protein PAC1 [Cryptococcus neoformans]|nr:nuclear distribution protein PAC1 [Cryptococcus neoformans]
MALSDRQKDELHRAMLAYLHAAGMHNAFAALQHDAALQDFDPRDTAARAVGLLEKKWTSVIRLQKKSSHAPPAQTPPPPSSPARPPRHTLASHRAPVTRLAFHPAWTLLATASEDATVKLWDWEGGEMERTLKGHTKAVVDVDFDPRGSLMALIHQATCSSDLTVKLWDTANDYTNVKTLHGHDHSVSSVRFMPDGDSLVSASRDKTIRVWQVSSGYCTKTFSGHAEWVREVVPSEDGRWLTSRVWDFSTGETKMELRGHEHVVECAVFAPVNAYPAIRELAGLKPPAPGDTRAKSPGVYVATGSRDKTVKLWDALSGQCLRTFIGHDNWIRALVFHPTGKYLLSASDDKTIKVWDLANGRCTKTIEAHSHFVTCMAWGRAVVGGAGGGAGGGEGNKGGVNGEASASKESRRINVLATGSVDQTIKVP